MTYIQDKLDTFEQFLMEKCPSHTNNSPEGFENWLARTDIEQIFDYAMDFRNKALTDYHNHIVEKVLGVYVGWRERTEERDDSYDDAFLDGTEVMQQKILSLLQDTNPKEL